jgi:hypothetical protein
MDLAELNIEEAQRRGRELYESLPEWHKRNSCLLVNSLMEAKRVAPHLANLADQIIPRLPRIVKESQSIKTNAPDKGSAFLTLEKAITCPWISWDSNDFWNVLALDIDHADGLDLWEDLPPAVRPTLVIDPWSGRSAALFPLATPVGMAGSMRQGPKILADLCHRLLADHFKATALPHKTLTKNPWGLKEALIGTLQRRTDAPTAVDLWEMMAGSPLIFHTVPGAPKIELRDVLDALADTIEEVSPPRRRRKITRPEPSDLGRNCHLFDVVRFWAYDTNTSDMERIYMKAQEENQGELPFKEVAGIAKSISRFMASRYRPKSRLEDRRGVMGLEGSGLATQQKQKLSAHRTNDIKTDNTDHKIRQALKHFPPHQKITQQALAKASGVSLRTIKSRWSTIKPTT